MYKRKDYYYEKAKKEGYRSRAAYKLKEINRRFRVIRKGNYVLDLGCSPGGWLQVTREIVGERGYVLGVDKIRTLSLKFDNVDIVVSELED
ncbi:MAG: 23S rRNA (uridine(2552)-2'-O)-methyltransferase, partial [Methanomicrobia archaeon]|nr:23S rRNA (uridine(2552)-2'-O)-methyltransferase [Methanomicrobia archaeon]